MPRPANGRWLLALDRYGLRGLGNCISICNKRGLCCGLIGEGPQGGGRVFRFSRMSAGTLSNGGQVVWVSVYLFL